MVEGVHFGSIITLWTFAALIITTGRGAISKLLDVENGLNNLSGWTKAVQIFTTCLSLFFSVYIPVVCGS